MTDDLTVVYYTCNQAPEKFLKKNRDLIEQTNLPIISVSHKPIDFGLNICVGDIGRSHLNIYRQALIGAKEAHTKYIAMAEDDVLYSNDHFSYTPTDDCFAYDMNMWTFYEFYRPRVFSYKERVNMNGLICQRDLFVEAMEERFAAWPDDSVTPIRNWAEPGKDAYEHNLRVTKRNKETYYAKTPSVAFYHPAALSYLHLGRRKKIGEKQVDVLEPWGSAKEMLSYYYK